MEMPMDVLNKRLGDFVANGDIDFDNTAAAMDIDQELQAKFLFIPFEELEAVEIENDRGRLHAGTGPEHCAAGENENPNWLYNHAMNALALWWRLKNDQEKAEQESKEAAKLARRPEPGVYHLDTGGPTLYLVAVTADRRIIDLRSNGKPADFTDVFDGLGEVTWKFKLIETGLGA